MTLNSPTTSPVSLACDTIRKRLLRLDRENPDYATQFVDLLLEWALSVGVSDLHLHPESSGLSVRVRRDGVLQPLGVFPHGSTASIVARLKVLADLLTYRTDIPQEGRIRRQNVTVEMRVSTMPTLHGERAVIRIFSADRQLQRIDELGFPPDIVQRLGELLGETSGLLLVTGPAGSGKTTSLYAFLRSIEKSSHGGRSIVTLEDPIEVAIDGVAQSQVNPPAGLTLASGLKSLLRQDPEVMMVGEIRDKETAEVSVQASLTGHLILTTFHAGNSATALGRLLDMGIEPYLIKSGVMSILSQRLVRRLCTCARSASEDEYLGLEVSRGNVPVGCDACDATGYHGRVLIAELLDLSAAPSLGAAVLKRRDVTVLNSEAIKSGMVPLWDRGLQLVEAGLTSPAELRRVLGSARHTKDDGAR